MTRSLRTNVSEWNGKDTAVLERLFNARSGDPEFLPELVQLCSDTDLQRGATWLLKHFLEKKGRSLSAALTRTHLAQLPHIGDWQARLHVLQYLEHLDLQANAEKPVSDFLETTLTSDNKFVRAWAWYGLAVLAHNFPRRAEHTVQRLTGEIARETAGSVKVRIRKALKLLTP